MKTLRALLLAALVLPTLSAYDVDRDDSGIYTVVWKQGSIPMRILLPVPAFTLTDGSTYAGSVAAAMQAWNARLGVVQFASQATTTPANPPVGTYGSGNDLNEIAMDSQYSFGSERKDFGSNTLAITVTYSQGNFRVESDIIFNTAYTWNSYRGNLTGQQDIQRVAIHELGHALGLDHPDQATPKQTVSAIMNSTVSNIATMQADDIEGAQLLYAAPGSVPGNDTFANATPITLSGNSIQLSSTNVAATKQTGEPSHAGASAPSGHSVWWKWTAPSSGSTTITTLGSNFDSVLAVYTGSAVNGLALVGSNDDVERGVIRTSTVTFNAVGGTTYSVAVDGWGSTAQQDQFTYTGAIKLNLNFTGSVDAAPVFTTQPASQTVTAGNGVTFTAAASGTPTPTYQWKKGGANISGATASSYTIASTNSGNAGNYTVVATNSAGSATSNTATLTVNAALAAPVITTQPAVQSVAAGSAATFNVEASGNPTPTYQWRKAGVAISGATASSYVISSVLVDDVAGYSVIVTNSQGSVTSNSAALSIAVGGATGTVQAGFDAAGYLTRYPDVAAVFGSNHYAAWLYYRDYGIYQGEVFDELFRVEEYLALYPELLALFGTDLRGALLHWLTQGQIEGKLGRIPLEFSATGYFARNPDVAAAVGNNPVLAWGHYWNYGIYEGRAYDDELRVFEYLAINADLTAAFVNDWRSAALHWMRYGRTEGRLGRLPLIFNSTEYLNRNPDVAATWGTDPTTVFLHFWLYGINEGRTFDNEFRVDEYLALNPDLAALFGSDRRGAFKHWVRYGRAEGRPGRNP